MCSETLRDSPIGSFNHRLRADAHESLSTMGGTQKKKDASSVGFGYSVHGDSEARGGGRWLAADADRHINEKELLAVVFALKALSPPMSHKLVILVDSTVAFHALRKGYSASPGVNQVCAEIWGLIPKTTALDLRWIPSVANPADPPSRGSFQWDSINAKWIELYAEYPMVFGHELSHLR